MLPKLKVNRYFPVSIITAYISVGRLGLNSLKNELLVEAIRLLTSLYLSSTLSAFLLKDSLELLQLKVEIDLPMLEADCNKHSSYVTKS